jgi:RNA polymerase sigma-70 factor (ECF subfamily)
MDKETFSSKILIFSDQLFRIAHSILLDEETAKDCVQDLYLKLWEKRNRLNKVENPSSFVMKSMRNLCLDKLRKKREFDFENSNYELKPDEISLQKTLEQKDMTKLIKQYINQLPELQRKIIRLRDVEGFEIKEIAYITATSENAVTVNLSRARRKIRDELMRRCDD